MNRLDHAAEQAYRVLIDRRVTALPVDPLFLLRQCRNTAVLTYREAAAQLSLPVEDFGRLFGMAEAFTLRQGARYIVIYRPEGNPARLRFTLAHELGHRVLGHTGERAQEQEADVFASHLLCPRPLVEGLTPEEIAVRCYVSLPCARRLMYPAVTVDEALLRTIAAQMTD